MPKGNRPRAARLNPESINALIQGAVAPAGLHAAPYSPTASGPGSSPTPTFGAPPTGPSPTRPATDPAITLSQYIRIHEAWKDNAATQLRF